MKSKKWNIISQSIYSHIFPSRSFKASLTYLFSSALPFSSFSIWHQREQTDWMTSSTDGLFGTAGVNPGTDGSIMLCWRIWRGAGPLACLSMKEDEVQLHPLPFKTMINVSLPLQKRKMLIEYSNQCTLLVNFSKPDQTDCDVGTIRAAWTTWACVVTLFLRLGAGLIPLWKQRDANLVWLVHRTGDHLFGLLAGLAAEQWSVAPFTLNDII